MNDNSFNMMEHLLKQIGHDASDKIEKAMTEALLFGSATLTVNAGDSTANIVYTSQPQDPRYWGKSITSIIMGRDWEQEVDFD